METVRERYGSKVTLFPSVFILFDNYPSLHNVRSRIARETHRLDLECHACSSFRYCTL